MVSLTALLPRLSKARGAAALLGPAFVAAIAYVDPGNVATNTQAGAEYGYLLVWVVVAANLMACVVQYLSAKLGLVTGQSLPEAVGERLGKGSRIAFWLQAEVVAMATDLAEVLGGAIALNLLFGLPVLLGGVITGVISTVLLAVQNRSGQRRFEYVITALLLVIVVGFLAGLFVAPPSGAETLNGLVPRFGDLNSVVLAAGILGATVMPHAVYLHSALARDRHGKQSPEQLPDMLRTTRTDVGAAMILAGAVNLGMLLLAAAALGGRDGVDSIEGVYGALNGTLGGGIGLLFALGLLAAGFASTSVGCYAGSVVMQGLLRTRIRLIVRRTITLIPALVFLAAGADPTKSLVISQVVLSFGLPFALIPLVWFTSRRSVMGDSVNRRPTTVIAWLVTAVIVALNIALIVLTLTGAA
ncbi:Nramp family divalent metal transporter [Sciscionella sediminilitoris]|uniref:Nramp family divalent metal transporter n=1 Tax=Sciscionella sediminilitoris TaxID=1445613 RepID=UPI000B32F6FA|nr:Nramp family divalent metal transporter [Sciscionella sp. SE31]